MARRRRFTPMLMRRAACRRMPAATQRYVMLMPACER